MQARNLKSERYATRHCLCIVLFDNHSMHVRVNRSFWLSWCGWYDRRRFFAAWPLSAAAIAPSTHMSLVIVALSSHPVAVCRLQPITHRSGGATLPPALQLAPPPQAVEAGGGAAQPPQAAPHTAVMQSAGLQADMRRVPSAQWFEGADCGPAAAAAARPLFRLGASGGNGSAGNDAGGRRASASGAAAPPPGAVPPTQASNARASTPPGAAHSAVFPSPEPTESAGPAPASSTAPQAASAPEAPPLSSPRCEARLCRTPVAPHLTTAYMTQSIMPQHANTLGITFGGQVDTAHQVT